MSDVTHILSQIQSGDPSAAEQLLPLVYEELRKLAAAKLGHSGTFSNELTTVEDDHVPFLRAGIPSVDIIDLDNPTWHTPQDTIEFVAARSLQIVGDVVLAALPEVEKRLASQR